ncbi:hypothetical protein [Brevibacillus laterosporus]|uniref:hypothetical protein n=1 Tax=Brevibacillus laterosporus TaxID=1465 RepID=UPI002655B56D|nr:hypothetical protein [Brevibacillus laterosporus]MDN9009734.1 hypothetical protein [Brevibacillus laterosporus]MDO0940267.1 hypothetical protein [Brevibacillus laterosporus]
MKRFLALTSILALSIIGTSPVYADETYVSKLKPDLGATYTYYQDVEDGSPDYLNGYETFSFRHYDTIKRISKDTIEFQRADFTKAKASDDGVAYGIYLVVDSAGGGENTTTYNDIFCDGLTSGNKKFDTGVKLKTTSRALAYTESRVFAHANGCGAGDSYFVRNKYVYQP